MHRSGGGVNASVCRMSGDRIGGGGRSEATFEGYLINGLQGNWARYNVKLSSTRSCACVQEGGVSRRLAREKGTGAVLSWSYITIAEMWISSHTGYEAYEDAHIRMGS